MSSQAIDPGPGMSAASIAGSLSVAIHQQKKTRLATAMATPDPTSMFGEVSRR
jgi:hypothetical protein